MTVTGWSVILGWWSWLGDDVDNDSCLSDCLYCLVGFDSAPDATATPLSLALLKCGMSQLFWRRLTQVVPENKPLNGCLCCFDCAVAAHVTDCTWWIRPWSAPTTCVSRRRAFATSSKTFSCRGSTLIGSSCRTWRDCSGLVTFCERGKKSVVYT